MRVGGALKTAVRQLYEQSWRLVLMNLALSAVVIVVLVAASYTLTAFVLLVAVGPFAAALMHCAVKLQQTDELVLRDGVTGLRLHWQRGLVLGALVAAAVAIAAVTIAFYARRGSTAWPLSVVAFYVAFMFAVWQIHLWPLAIARRRDRLFEVLRDAAEGLFRRPGATIGLAFALLLVNAVGAIGILPVLTLTIAFSALATANFALPPPTEEAT